ncbi:MAG: TRAP transporter substrate-binding protein DctP [Deltaproteobacteria bacterium]|nr:TRAP transporter substrate-binding protein DctP [Deltaproteobacteria bacterium]
MNAKRFFILSLSLCFVLLFVTAPITSGADKPIILKLAPGNLPNDKALFGGIPEWKSEIEKRTQGRVKIDVYYGGTLAKGRENIDAMQSDLADVIFPAPHHQPGKLPLYTIGDLPGLTNDYWAKAKAFHDLAMTEKPLLDEFAKFGGHPIGSAYYPPGGLISGKPIKTLDEMKGLKISARFPSSDLIAKFGAAPLSIAPPEEYEALLRRTVDAIACPVAAVYDFKFWEVAKYYTTFNLGDRQHVLLINDSSFAKLTPADQKIIDDFAEEYQEISYKACAIGLEPRGTEDMKKNGVNFVTPNSSDKAKLLVAANEVAAAWVDEMTKKGLPGFALFNRYKELIKKYEAISPYK